MRLLIEKSAPLQEGTVKEAVRIRHLRTAGRRSGGSFGACRAREGLCGRGDTRPGLWPGRQPRPRSERVAPAGTACLRAIVTNAWRERKRDRDDRDQLHL